MTITKSVIWVILWLLGSAISARVCPMQKEANRLPTVPPSWVFPVVWTTLYTLQALALSFTPTNKSLGRAAIGAGITTYLLSLLWVYYYGCQQKERDALWILLLVVLGITMQTGLTFLVGKSLGLMLIPYVVWCLYALILNHSVVLQKYK
jgi:benzodiazapine receptor